MALGTGWGVRINPPYAFQSLETAVPRIVPTGRLDEPIPTAICLHASEQNLATYRDSSRLVEYGVSC